MKYGGPYQIKIECNGSNILLKNILIGDVWLCSGQSNMEFPLKNAATGYEELKTMKGNNFLRLFKLNSLRETDNTPWDSLTLVKTNELKFFSGQWKTCNKNTVENFSAVAYYFGKKIQEQENIPIGLIQVDVGGSPIESWIDRYTIEHDNLLVDMLNNWRKSDFIMPWVRERADTNLKYASSSKQRHPYEPCYNYDAAIDSLTLFPIKGVIWYQGESNTHNAELYQRLFTTLVSSWRQKWGYSFPFYYVQLSSLDRPSWPDFRNEQRLLRQEVSNSGMAVSLDFGDSLNVHPTKKKPVGDRLARLALHYTYDKNIAANGPEPVTAIQDKKNIIISFAFAAGLSTSDKKPLIGFELVNEKGIYINANAIIKNDKVVIEIPKDEKIKKIVYAWRPFTRANLINADGLPASTFSIKFKQQ
jgi:sialate O-acetylesterase